MDQDIPNNNNPNNNVNNRLITANNSNLNDININAVTREFLRVNPQYGVINIQEFLNDPHVVHNPSGENYATSLQILLPWAETVTPMVTNSIKIYKLDKDNNPEEVLDTLSLDDATLIGENESFEVNKGDTVFMVQDAQEDDPATPDKNEKKWYQKAGAFVADGSKTIWNGGKKAAVWVWNHGGSDVLPGALKYGIGMAIDHFTGGTEAANNSAEGGNDQKYIDGSKAPIAIEAPKAEGDKGQLIPWDKTDNNSTNDNTRSGTRDSPNGYPDITDITDLTFNPERFLQVSYTIIKFPDGFWTNLANRKIESQRLLAEKQLARRLLLQQQEQSETRKIE